MRFTSIMLIAALGLLTAACCGGSKPCDASKTPDQPEVEVSAEERAAAPKIEIATIAGTYKGVIPAADCSGYDVTITIHPDGTATVLSLVVDDNSVVESYTGQVEIDSKTPQICIREEESVNRYNLVDGNLLMVSPDGAEPEMRDHYILKKQE